MHNNYHQLEVFSFVSYDFFSRWENQPTGARDEEYNQLKEKICDYMLNALENHFQGIRNTIVIKELGTPLTNKHYINAYKGNIYGIEKSIWQAGPLGFRTKTEFENLYLCGASTLAHGIAYASNTGLTAAAKILNCKAWDLLKRDGPQLQILQCEDLSK
jgi:phytoene dehydrogenase-like protein